MVITPNTPKSDALWQLLAQVCDPEIPVVSIQELGILQNITVAGDTILIDIIPTYSGCPAMFEIKQDIQRILHNAGYQNVEVLIKMTPAWSTDMMSQSAKEKLRAYGIAPPSKGAINCPQCNHPKTKKISEFGSTACKALYQCTQCLEPFDYFKCH